MSINFQNVSYTYQAGTPFEGRALFDIDLTILDGSYTAFIGHTGSGKSTIMQLLNGLHTPTKGIVRVGKQEITNQSKNKDIKSVRKHVGLVFQFPESQLFEETVLKDVAFGPQNFGVSQEEAEALAREKLALVGISENLFDKNPFELSGGQMRRVAIAGILAMQPDVLVLDEPTAGLDPKGRKELMTLFKKLHQLGMTIVLVTHLMDDVANYADFVYVLEEGKIILSGEPKPVFQRVHFLEEKQLGVPKVTKFAQGLVDRGMALSSLPITLEELRRCFDMDKLILGRYIPGNSLIHRLDPRSKLLAMIIYIIIIFWANNVVTNLLMLGFTLGVVFLSKIKLSFFLNGVKPMIGIILFTTLFQMFFAQGGSPIFRLGIITITDLGLSQAILIFMRFVLIIFFSTLLTLTTTPLSLSDAVESLLKPLTRFKVPAHEIGLMLSLSLRFVPTLMDDTTRIMNAQKARGVDFGEGNLVQK